MQDVDLPIFPISTCTTSVCSLMHIYAVRCSVNPPIVTAKIRTKHECKLSTDGFSLCLAISMQVQRNLMNYLDYEL